MKAKAIFHWCGMPEAMKGPMVANESMKVGTQLENKYLLAVEGVDKASNTQWIMMSGSVLVMPPPSQESWLLEGRLVPWVHYVSCVANESPDAPRLFLFLDHYFLTQLLNCTQLNPFHF